MKHLVPHTFNADNCRFQADEFLSKLAANAVLSERKDVLPFFKSRPDLSLLIGNFFPKIITPDVFAHEFQIDGDFVADLIIGDTKEHQYLLVEFEDGTPDGIFAKSPKAMPAWSRRFEGAHSQLIDWLYKLSDNRSTAHFATTFGSRHAKFHGLIVIGKDVVLKTQEQDRLKWRMDKTVIDSTGITAVTFDQLGHEFDNWLKLWYNV